MGDPREDLDRDTDELTEYDDEIELDEYEAFDCHMDRSGHCGAAGSEDCEFECPYRRDQYARERDRAARDAERKRSKGGRQPDLTPNDAATEPKTHMHDKEFWIG